MSDILKKMKIKEGQKVLILHAGSAYLKSLKPLLQEVIIENEADGIYDAVQIFVTNRQELEKEFRAMMKHIRKDTLVWIAFPKKSSGIQSDLNMYEGWNILSKFNYEGVAMISLDNTWSCCRVRPADQVKKSDAGNAALEKNDYGKYIDVKNKTVTLPSYLEKELKKHKEELAFYNSLAYSHRKEYVIWILSAKQEKTRQNRIEKMIEMLKVGSRNPGDR